jgi:hypothetical protein
MSNQFKGTAHIVGAEVVKSEKFKVRQLVVKDDSNTQYPNFVEFQFSNKNCDKLNGINVGDEITVDYNLRGREWTSPQGEVKYFNTLDGWKVTVDAKGNVTNDPIDNYAKPNNTPNISTNNDVDDLPW